VILVGLGMTIALLWRRNSHLTDERKRFEAEFNKDKRVWENFAAENPDDIARDLENLLGPAPTR
jgi:hypothetical protein